MDQAIAECDVVDQGSGLVGDRVKIAQAHVEIDLCAGRISGGGVNAKRITIRISKTKMVDDESQREALDVNDLRVFRGSVQPGGVVIAPETVGGQLQRTDAAVFIVVEKVIDRSESFLHRIAAFQTKVLHETRVKRIGQQRNIPAEKSLQILGATQVICVVEVNPATGQLRGIHGADHHKGRSLRGCPQPEQTCQYQTQPFHVAQFKCRNC